MMHGRRMGRGGPRHAPHGGPHHHHAPWMGRPPRPPRHHYHYPRFRRTGCLLPVIGVVILVVLGAWLMGWI